MLANEKTALTMIVITIVIIVVVVADVVIVVAVVVSFEVPKDLSHRLNHHDLPGRDVHRQRRRRRRLIVVGVVIVCITMISSCRWAPLCAAASDRRSGCHRGARRRWPCRLRLARTTRRRKLGHPVVDGVVAPLVRQDGRGRTAADFAGDVTAISRESAGKHGLREKRLGATLGNGRSGGSRSGDRRQGSKNDKVDGDREFCDSILRPCAGVLGPGAPQ